MLKGTKLTVLSAIQDVAFCGDGEWREFQEIGLRLPIKGVFYGYYTNGDFMAEVSHGGSSFVIPVNEYEIINEDNQ